MPEFAHPEAQLVLMAAPRPPVAMQKPDLYLRRLALEQWARNPTESLDLVGTALVDPEDSIREKAGRVFEEILTRRQ